MNHQSLSKRPWPVALAAALLMALPVGEAAAHEPTLAKPNLVMKQVVEALPGGQASEVRVLTASFGPGDKTVYHTHRFPVTVFVVEGAFTLEMKGRPPIVVKAGEAYVEPPNVEMTGYNRSTTDITKVVIFYVSTPDTPFLDIIN